MAHPDPDPPRLLDRRTDDLLARHRRIEAAHEDRFAVAAELAAHLGGRVVGDETAAFGFWTPEIVERGVETVFLEILTPPCDLDPGRTERREVRFDRTRVPLARRGEYHWGAVAGIRPGTRDTLGSLYRLAYETDDGWETAPDPLASSLPFGAFGPAELYDRDRLDRDRTDRSYFASLGTDDERVATTVGDDGVPRIDAATNVLEVHPGTATEAGSLGGLADLFESIGRKRRAGDDLSPWERNFAGYDAVELLPIEPVTESRERHDFWIESDDPDGSGDATGAAESADPTAAESVTATVARPRIRNWGYDPVIAGFAAPNPALLASGRPDELVDFVAACHAGPRPVRVVFDVVLGHAEGRATELLPSRYFDGPGPYGKRLNYADPTVRAVLLELLRRKLRYGADGIRVDASHDVRRGGAAGGESAIDDAFLAAMRQIVVEVAGAEYRPWTIYEDARPCPDPDWPLTATFRGLLDQHPAAFQWSPVTFGDNTPGLSTYWARNWWRLREVADAGDRWLTGVATHDTVRRGTQLDPHGEAGRVPVNPRLGDDPRERHVRAYDNAAVSLLFHAFLPGVPLDFAHANVRAPWGFFRDTDDGGVGVVADEANALHWAVRPADFDDGRFFRRTKALGFESLSALRSFTDALSAAVDVAGADPAALSDVLARTDHPFEDCSADRIRTFATAWLNDLRDAAVLERWRDCQDGARTSFRLRVREFRRDRPWLRHSLADGDYFAYRHPADGTVLYYGYRAAPADAETEGLLFAGNMEGRPVTVTPRGIAELAADDGGSAVPPDGWEPALVPPGVALGDTDGSASLDNAEAVVWHRPR
ncbi:glucosylglycerol hydrolase [Halobellus rubicundus]|uniref:Glucosylglycerol hydrolase n=1 Tax=Halobellus rubicundus TaxID=2996466 RepID=A0ABD5MCI5_9EURY